MNFKTQGKEKCNSDPDSKQNTGLPTCVSRQSLIIHSISSKLVWGNEDKPSVSQPVTQRVDWLSDASERRAIGQQNEQ